MTDLKIYGLNAGAVLFSTVKDFNPLLQTIVLCLTIAYTGIQIYHKIKK